MDFNGKVVVITGGSCGIGLRIIKKILTTDIKVITVFELENPNSTKVITELQREYDNRIDFYPCDVTNTLQLEGNFDKVLEKYGVIDILINNAGIINEDVPERMIDINYKSVVLGSLMMIERVGKHKGGKGGLIINIASILGLTNFILPVYCSTKHAVVSFTRTMKEQFDKTGVRVVGICPGVTRTGLLDNIDNGLDFIDSQGKIELLPTLQSPENVANALVDVVIVQGKSGDIWVAEEDQSPYLIKAFEDYKTLRVN